MSKPKSFRSVLLLVLFMFVAVAFATQIPIIKSQAENLFRTNETAVFNQSNLAVPVLMPSPTPELTHNLVAAFYDVQTYPNAKLLLNNKGLEAIQISPTLYNLDGIALTIPPVSVPANSHIFVNLSDWANIGGADFQKGSVKLFHTGKDLIIGSQIYLEDAANSLSFEERFVELGKFDSRRFEAIWAMPNNQTQVTFILSNTSDTTLSVNAKLSRKPQHTGETQTFTLQPHQTRVLDLRNDFTDGNQFANSDVVGLTLEHTGEKSALKAHGQIKDAPIGYSNIISFSNPNSGKSSELHGTGLHLGTIAGEELEPVVAVKNVGITQTNVTVKVPYTRTDGTSGTVNLNPINLQTGEMRLVNMNPVIQRSRQEQIQIAGIEISHAAAPGSIIVQAQSLSESKNQVYRVPMADPMAQTSSTGGYPWRIEPTSRTVSYIKNMTNLEQEYMAYLNWENGEYAIGIKKIAPNKTIEIDVKKLRDEQTADFRGRTIPIDLTSGQIKWTLRRKYNTGDKKTDEFALIGRSEQLDATNGISSSYACQNCCSGGFVGAVITTDSSGSNVPSNYDFEVGEFVQFYAFQDYIDCYGNPIRSMINAADWDSNHEDIATVNSTGGVEILAVGDVEIDADVYGYFYFGIFECGPYLVEVCDDNSEKQKKEIEPTSAAPCGTCEGQEQHYEPDAEISVIPAVTNVTADGATRITQIIGNASIIHFVTPRGGTNDQVTLTATLSENTQEVLDEISWEGATESTANPLQANVQKSTASRETVKIKYRGNIIRELRVWIVWATITVTETFPIVAITGQTGRPAGTAHGIEGGYTFTHTIQPATLITDPNRPNFSGVNVNAPPGGNHPINGDPLSNGANRKWDSSRQIRFKILNPNNILSTDTSFVLTGIPTDLETYPTNDLIGNDDRATEDEMNDPYNQSGVLLSQDIPPTYMCDRAGANENTFESRLHFREFTRLEIQGTWHRISDFFLWRFHRRLIKANGVWVNNNSVLALSNSDF